MSLRCRNRTAVSRRRFRFCSAGASPAASGGFLLQTRARALRSAFVAALFAICGMAAAADGDIRLCADPHNLPYSSENGAGFENRIAGLVAREIGARIVPVWLPQGRGYVRKTLNAGLCDVIAGVPQDFEAVRATAPYYRSSYVFVSRAADAYSGFDDPRLAKARIGVQLVGDEATPPAHVLAARGLTDNVAGYPIYGERPQVQRMIDDVASGAIDVALAWGPPAGYFASLSRAPLHVAIADAPPEAARLPFAFSIAMGVRKNDAALQQRIDAALARLRPSIDAILTEYHVPRVNSAPQAHAERSR
jgi:mxaJ protein